VIIEATNTEMHGAGSESKANAEETGENEPHQSEKIPMEDANEDLLGKPTVVVKNLRKTFGSQLAVNNLSFKMYENQIFALLGHNGAGKTTTISMLTGLFSPDYATKDSGAFVYGHSIADEMDSVRHSLGICPQHDVLFENLTVREHILFFAQLKGYSLEAANEESTNLTNFFHLESRLDHTGTELSGGQKRKLSVAIALCGGSKFVVLDEPTAGMDPLARRELWDLLASLRRGRTMLLTTHYMDESEVLGDRVGIMSLGQMQCLGTPQFLKTTYGAGYKLIFDKTPTFNEDQMAKLNKFVHSYIPEAKHFEEDGSENQILYSLPFQSVDKFGTFFNALEVEHSSFNITSYGVTITSLEDVFLKVGGDHTVTPKEEIINAVSTHGIGKVGANYDFSLTAQIIGLAKRKLTYAINDFITLPLVLLPICTSLAAVVLYNQQTISNEDYINDLVISGMIIGSYLGAPGLIAEFLVRERNDKLRNVLTVMGCDFKAYWIGTFIADYIIMFVPTVCLWIMWPAANMPDFYASQGGLCFFLLLLFNFQLIAFSYFFSFVFASPKSCITLMPIIILVLVLLPNVVILILIEIAQAFGTSISGEVIGGTLLWGLMLMTPLGALFAGLLDTTQDYSSFISNFPPVSATIIFMLFEGICYLGYAYYIDSQSVASVEPVENDPTFDERSLEILDDDVKDERERTLNPNANNIESGSGKEGNDPLKICRLRKVFPPKRQGQKAVIATEDVAFKVKGGEIFGLLGANGAGKTTTLSMLTRHLVPTSGNAFVTGYSILTDFPKASTHLGVVTQNNSLWDRLSVEAHLKLFARLRGVREDQVYKVVDATIDQLELTPHRHKLAMKLSGGMKRKLCVAIALIGDPEVVLLDEPSAGLDPVSRRNLWSVILRTMSQRAVILTTHSMEEAEALCQRIAIMVKGQIRALGTKQHLKYKFGSGYELSAKLRVQHKTFQQQLDKLTNFVTEIFPTSTLLAENGGLVTYQIPRQEMHMGKAFSALEANKVDLEIEDYTIAQPTLEQVRISFDIIFIFLF
jgi:ATP-binding cassette subfamily A (ABC1) protein 3